MNSSSRSVDAGEQHRAGHREDQDDRELGDRQPARHEVVRREHDREHDDRDEQDVEERRQRVDRVGAAERRAAPCPPAAGRDGVTAVVSARPIERRPDRDGPAGPAG